MSAVVIYSGGMDSFTLLNTAIMKHGIDNVYALSFMYGQRHSKELEYAQEVCEHLPVKHTVIRIPGESLASALTSPDIDVPEGHYVDENMKLTVVPGRNTIMLAFAMGFAESVGAEVVYYGAHAGDHAIYPDCRPEFLDAMNQVGAVAGYQPIRFAAPFLDMTKGEILQYGLDALHLDPQAYADTWTCYKGGAKPCGKCGSCVERLEAFADAGVPDPLEYANG